MATPPPGFKGSRTSLDSAGNPMGGPTPYINPDPPMPQGGGALDTSWARDAPALPVEPTEKAGKFSKLKGMFKRQGNVDADIPAVHKDSGGGIKSFSLGGFMGSFRNKFKRGGTETPPYPGGIEEPASLSQSRDNLSGSQDNLFGPPPAVRSKSKGDDFFKRPQSVDPRNYSLDKAILNDEPEREYVRMSRILDVTLVIGIIVGLIMTACIGINSNLLYVGPVILGLSIFALCGKAFFTLFWEDDPLPRLNPYVEKINNYIEPPAFKGMNQRDVFGTNNSDIFNRPSSMGFQGPMGGPEHVPMQEINPYAQYRDPSAEPRMYDESIDTTLRVNQNPDLSYQEEDRNRGQTTPVGRSTPTQGVYNGRTTPTQAPFNGRSTPTQAPFNGRSTPQQGEYGGAGFAPYDYGQNKPAAFI